MLRHFSISDQTVVHGFASRMLPLPSPPPILPRRSKTPPFARRLPSTTGTGALRSTRCSWSAHAFPERSYIRAWCDFPGARKMRAGYRRKSLQLFEGELQWMIHHAMDQEPIFLGIDIRNNGAAVSTHKMERGGRDDAHRILKRTQHMKRHAEIIRRHSFGHRYAHRSHKMRALAIGDQALGDVF